MSTDQIETSEAWPNVEEQVRSKILYSLSVYPWLSHSLLHMSIGSSMMSDIWKPQLEALVESGKVVCVEIQRRGPTNRLQTHTLYGLANTPIPLAESTAG